MAVKDGLPSTDFSRMNREYIKAVAEGGSGGGGLPEITEADEGKFLGVVSGEAAWATAGGGGGEILVCSSSIIPDDPDENMILNKSWTEISSAIADNIPVFVVTIYDSSPVDAVVDIITAVYYDEGTGYTVKCAISDTTYFAATASDYPQTNVNG